MAKILVVDDEQDVLEMMARILRKSGHLVTTARSGSECLDKLKGVKHDLVLLDIVMPGMSGFDVYRKIRESDNSQKVAFVSVLEVSPDRREEMKRDGITDYINKPFTQDELLSRVNSLL